tara:strand:- start:1213 stop:2049 length:837 start_codon:yes stop_codon:yes gene_type:complete
MSVENKKDKVAFDKRTRKKRKRRRKRKSKKKRGGDQVYQRWVNYLIKQSKRNIDNKGSGKKERKKFIDFMKKSSSDIKKYIGKNASRFSDIIKKGTGSHTPCLTIALANQSKCIGKNKSSNRPNGIGKKYTSELLDSVCSQDNLQKVIQEWNEGENPWSNNEFGCGGQVLEDALRISSEKDDKAKKEAEKFYANMTPEEISKVDEVKEASEKVLDDEQNQRKLYGDDAYLLNVDNVFQPDEYTIRIGGNKKKGKTSKKTRRRRKRKKTKKRRSTRKKR